MKQVLIQGGGVKVEEVPAPQVGDRNVLVRVEYSCVSVGTEMASVSMSGLPLYKRALKQPDNVKRVLEMMRDQGVKRTLDRVQGKLSAGSPTGYSAAGKVVAVGEMVNGFEVGDRVACAGAGIANHAELIDVPVNLAVKIPETVGADDASTVTLGAIAMQGVRRANPTLGEIFVVVGLGILGQITVQLLKANGCTVLGVDVDPNRVQIAIEKGMDKGLTPAEDDYVAAVHRITDGFGADAVVVTASGANDEIISQAMQACRKKGRVVLVGDVGLNLNRADFYKKELDFLISTSYGPGRYDPVYEEEGQDYPIGYVRWTENRNMQAYLQLLATDKLTLKRLYGEPYEVDRADIAYESLKGDGKKPLMVLLRYPVEERDIQRRVELRTSTALDGTIRVGLAGAGGFAQGMHLPNLVKLRKSFSVRAIMSRTGANARAVATQFEAAYATTEYEELLRDPDVDLVMITTRHNLHGQMVLDALRAGKHVFVEKPLALNSEELEAIEKFYSNNPNGPTLMVGFNRRFAPTITRVQEILKDRSTPMIVNYRMNAGFIPPDHWVHGPEGGGRNIGEACHIYDLFSYLTSSVPASVSAHSIKPSGAQWRKNDNFVATVKYEDGSVCTLTYTALGSKSYPKERMDIFCDGKVLSMDDFRVLKITGSKAKGLNLSAPNKGQLVELESLGRALSGGDTWPILLEDMLRSTRLSFEIENQLDNG